MSIDVVPSLSALQEAAAREIARAEAAERAVQQCQRRKESALAAAALAEDERLRVAAQAGAEGARCRELQASARDVGRETVAVAERGSEKRSELDERFGGELSKLEAQAQATDEETARMRQDNAGLEEKLHAFETCAHPSSHLHAWGLRPRTARMVAERECEAAARVAGDVKRRSGRAARRVVIGVGRGEVRSLRPREPTPRAKFGRAPSHRSLTWRPPMAHAVPSHQGALPSYCAHTRCHATRASESEQI